MLTLLCSVRGCHRPLARGERRVVCPRGHSFDVARSGYVNLLQPQDRRSRRPGDATEAVEARRRFVARGFATPLVDATMDLLAISPGDAALDVGCGEGHCLAALTDRFGCQGYGVDIAVGTIAAAAKRYPPLHWVVANADRFIPFAEASFGAVTSITARLNAAEFRRILRDDGTLLIGVPAPDDLVELRKAVLGEGVLRDRLERTVATFAPLFTLERHQRLRHIAPLDAAAIRDVLTSSYRALRPGQRARVAALGDLDVTLSRDVLLFRPKRRSRRTGRA